MGRSQVHGNFFLEPLDFWAQYKMLAFEYTFDGVSNLVTYPLVVPFQVKGR
jgi:hypothetical protein